MSPRLNPQGAWEPDIVFSVGAGRGNNVSMSIGRKEEGYFEIEMDYATAYLLMDSLYRTLDKLPNDGDAIDVFKENVAKSIGQ